ncbi:MAG TPA: phosphatase PAP2 family protein, partial [Candidatus Polarisedimenticolia bacterium]|nr:phosphatase PAP2 family protein [Candidatus Polarisedimenticolia bacterium]
FWGSITWLGTVKCLAAAVFFLAFAVRFRIGLAVLVLLLVNSLATDLLKDRFAIPRPGDVDQRVQQLSGDGAHPIAAQGGATGFWSSLPGSTLEAARSTAGLSYAFPSGHVSSAAALTLSLALLFRSRRLWLLAAVWIPLTGLSRLFLGRHYVADILGGAALGAAVALLGWLLFGAEALGLERGAAAPWRRAALVALAGGALLLAVFVPGTDIVAVGRLVALVILLFALPPAAFDENVDPIFRLARMAVAILLPFAVAPVLAAAFEALGLASSPRGPMLSEAILILVAFGGGALAARFIPFAGRHRVRRATVGEA